MKYIPLVIVGLCLISACNESASPKAAKAPSYDVKMLSTNMDYVCGMELTSEMIADTAQYDGKTYGFCHSGCKDAFKKEPNKFLSQN